MAYTQQNFKTKKELKNALAEGRKIPVYHPGLGEVPFNGTVHLEGPHFPKPHTWYATGIMVEGFLDSVK